MVQHPDDAFGGEDRFNVHHDFSPLVTAIWRRSNNEFILENLKHADNQRISAVVEQLTRPNSTSLELMERSWHLQRPLAAPHPIRVHTPEREVILQVEAVPLPFDRLLLYALDVSAQLAAAERVIASERRTERILEFHPDGMVVCTAGTIVYANRTFVRMAGARDRTEVVGRKPLSFVHPDDQQFALGRIRKLERDGQLDLSSIPERLIRADGSSIYVEVAALTFEYDDAPSILVVLRDVSDRQRQQEALREREQLFSAVIDELPIGVVVADATGRVIRSNAAADEIWGFHRTHVAISRPNTYHGWWVDSGRAVADEEWASTRALRDGVTTLNELIEIERSDGLHRVILNSAVPLRGPSGEIHGAVIMNQDVTEARKKEQEQQAADARLGEVIASAPDGICTVDTEGCATLVSPSAAAMLGRPEDELLGREFHAIVHAGGRDKRDVFKEVMRSRQSQPLYQDTFVRSDGTRFEVEVSCAPIVVEDEVHGAVITFRDVTRRRLLERELERAQRFSSIGQLAATVSHEFNNVLVGISPFVEVIEHKAGGDEILRVVLQRIQQAVQRGKQITREILKFAQAPEPRMVPIRLRSLFESSLPELQAIAGARIAVELPAFDDGFAACVDPIQIHQALSNLVANARDAMHGVGTITIEVTAPPPGAIPNEPAAEWICIAVADGGPGIEPHTLERIFEPLFTTKQAGGTGLGLPVVQQVVTAHGGILEVDSTVGIGTTFKLFFRRCAPPEARPGTEKSATTSSVDTIVLVEDDDNVAAGLKSILELEGIRTHVVTLGAHAEDAVERHAPDAVLIDRGLPDMDGLDVAQRLLARWPELPLIFATGHGSQEQLGQLPAEARVSFLLKPYFVTDLLETLEKLIRRDA
jgi:two-component system cell cycle sensor histidine kinase/response regulator CckA